MFEGVRFRSRVWRDLFFGTIVLGLILVFWIPALFPPTPAASESYMFGFNNRICQLLFAALIVAVFAIAKNGGLILSQSQRDLSTGPGRLTTKLLVGSLALATTLSLAMFFLLRPLGGINDGAYFLDRIHLLTRGQVPFRDFEFLYGSGPLYTAAMIARVLHTSPNDGYYLIWIGETVSAFVLLWASIRWIELPAGGKRVLFLLYGSIFLLLIPAATLNYTGFRYALPLFAAIGFCRLHGDNRWFTRVGAVAFASLMTAALLWTSPEEGIVFAVAVILYLPLRRIVDRQAFVPDVLVLIASVSGLLVATERTGAFATMKRFGAGAFNLPLYPGLALLFAVTAVLVCVCYLASGVLVERIRSNVFLLTIYGLGILAAAMGRCDGIHIVGYLMPILLCALLLCWRSVTTWRVGTLWFSAAFLVLPLLLGIGSGQPVLGKALLLHLYAGGVPTRGFAGFMDRSASSLAVRFLGETRGRAKMAAIQSASIATSFDPHDHFPGISPIVSVPFSYIPNKISRYQNTDIDEGYFMGTLNILTPAEVDRKIDEIRNHPEEDLVVALEGPAECVARTGDRAFMRSLLLIPWVPKPVHPLTLMVPYCTYLQQHYDWLYQPSAATFGYGIMRRKPGL